MLFDPANLPYWIFLGIGVILFLLVIFAGGGDIDSDMDADIDADADGDFGSFAVLGWLGIGQAPLILLLATDLSVWGVTGWMLNVWIGKMLGHIPSNFFGFGGVVLLGSLILSLFIGSLIARPIGKVFAAFGEDTSSDRLIGCIGRVTSVTIPLENQGKIGQVDAIDSAHNLVTISATLPEWATVFPRRGDKVIVIDRLTQSYLVIAKDSLDQERWLNNYPSKKSPH